MTGLFSAGHLSSLVPGAVSVFPTSVVAGRAQAVMVWNAMRRPPALLLLSEVVGVFWGTKLRGCFGVSVLGEGQRSTISTDLAAAEPAGAGVTFFCCTLANASRMVGVPTGFWSNLFT